MPSTKVILDQIREKQLEVYTSESMTCLSSNELCYKGVNIMAVPNSQHIQEDWDSYKNLRDLINCNQDLMYFTGNLFLYRPLINNPLEDIDNISFAFPLSHYHQNIYDHRYCTYVSCCFEKTYNYWDRIGDLFYSFYPTLINNIRSVDFSRIIDQVYALGERDNDFLWLYELRQNQYTTLNKFRRDVVHYYQYETTYHHDHAMNATKLDVLAQLWEEKRGFPEYFRNHLELSCDGCVKAYSYLNKVLGLRAQNPNAATPPIPVQS